jgi:hypothetical protein
MDQAPAIDAADFRFIGKGSTSHDAAWLAARKTNSVTFIQDIIGGIMIFP